MPLEPVHTYTAGVLVATRQELVSQEFVNRRTLEARARAALADNAAFLAIASPTAGQNAAQAKALTRQVNALIRLALHDVADVSDA
jgi:hypothetical protein